MNDTGPGVAREPIYDHTQVSRLTIAGLIVGLATVLAGFLHDLSRGRARAWAHLPGMLGLAFAAYMLSSLTARIWEDRLDVAFAGGLFSRRVALAEVQAAEVVRVPWYAGWGWRITSTGWLYSVWGRDAVELRLKGGRTLSIGTDEPHLLLGAVEVAVAADRARDSARV